MTLSATSISRSLRCITNSFAPRGQPNHEAATRHSIHAAHDHRVRAGTRCAAGDAPAEWAADASAARAADEHTGHHRAGSACGSEGSDSMADLLGRVQRAAAQPLDAADTAKHRRSGPAVDFPD